MQKKDLLNPTQIKTFEMLLCFFLAKYLKNIIKLNEFVIELSKNWQKINCSFV